MDKVETKVEIFTDGACKGNPGLGGWGAFLVADAAEKEICGGARDTTNNRMELQAVIEALNTLKRPCMVTLHTDSQYVQKGISEWIHGWKARGWKTAAREPVKNEDLWKRAGRRAGDAHGRMALGARPQRPSWQRTGRHAGQSRRRTGAGPMTVRGLLYLTIRFITEHYAPNRTRY